MNDVAPENKLSGNIIEALAFDVSTKLRLDFSGRQFVVCCVNCEKRPVLNVLFVVSYILLVFACLLRQINGIIPCKF